MCLCVSVGDLAVSVCVHHGYACVCEGWEKASDPAELN